MLAEVRAGFHLDPEPANPLAASRAAAARVVGRRYGIVGEYGPVESPCTPAALHIYAAAGARRIPGWRFAVRATGTGVSLDPEAARLAAIAEAVESYVSMAPAPPDRVLRSSYLSLPNDAVPPSRFALHSARQYRRYPRLQPLTADSVIDWCQGWSLVTAQPAWVPAALAYLSYPHAAPNNFVADTTSTGIAAHVSLAPAILSGALECMERDAVCIVWANRIACARIDPRGTSIDDVAATAVEAGADIALYEVPTDLGYPTVIAVAWSEAPPHAAIGVACRRDHASAAFKAICEAVQMRARLHTRSPATPQRVRTFDDHADFYAGRIGARLLREVIDTGPVLRLAELPHAAETTATDALGGMTESLRRRGLDLLVVELTTPDVAAAGYRVVRVIIPGLIDTCADARFPRLGGERLSRVAVDLGIRGGPVPESRLNVLPSPIA